MVFQGIMLKHAKTPIFFAKMPPPAFRLMCKNAHTSDIQNVVSENDGKHPLSD